jgi:hypothetical protein
MMTPNFIAALSYRNYAQSSTLAKHPSGAWIAAGAIASLLFIFLLVPARSRAYVVAIIFHFHR